MSTVRSVSTLVREKNITHLAAGIAYYAFVSIIPMMLLAVAVASFVGGQALADRVTTMLGEQLTSSGQQIVTETLTNTTGRGGASIVGLIALTWSSLKLFRGLDLAFDEIYTDDIEASLLDQIQHALVVIVGIGIAIALVVAVGIALSVLPVGIPLINVFGLLVLVVVLTIAFLPIYYVLPPVDVSLREVLPGAAIAAVGWVLLQIGFRIYAANADRYAAYGLIGAVLLFVTWLYFASMVVLLGAAVNAVRSGTINNLA
ncbi:YihY/virulence factor BrkB family protein [Halomarina pelagica]|uniref:YihY/virulence factor BrkB family protein n=1 Tax=Halomarina pelagica TaxID=2961599 RepID=UPI0020C47B05|nr:YihY/virulence factor BrkB family protein [Halomarina sp. BND7]